MKQLIAVFAVLGLIAACTPVPTELPQDFDPTFEF